MVLYWLWASEVVGAYSSIWVYLTNQLLADYDEEMTPKKMISANKQSNLKISINRNIQLLEKQFKVSEFEQTKTTHKELVNM